MKKLIAILISAIFVAVVYADTPNLTGYANPAAVKSALDVAKSVGTTTGIVKSNGSGTISAATAGTDYLAPTGSGAGLSGVVTTETDPTALLTAGTDNVKDTHIDWGSNAGQVGITDVYASAWKLFYSNGSNIITELALGDSGKVLKSNGASAAPTWETDSTGSGYTDLTSFDAQTAWRLFYSDGSGDTTELALGTAGQYLKSAGADQIPTWDTPTGSGDVSKVGTPSNHQFGIWTGNGTIEGVTVTGSKVVCTDADGEPVACTNLADSIYLTSETGDVSGVGDCTSGACLDGSSDGGTYVRLYDGDSHYGQIAIPDIAGNVTYTFPATTGTVMDLQSAQTVTGDKTFSGNVGLPKLAFSDADWSPDAVGLFGYDNTVTGLLDGAMVWYDDDAVRYIIDLDTLPSNDDYVVSYDADNDKFYMKADDGAGSSVPLSGGTMTGNLTLDDGTGASPNIVLTDETNESTTITKLDSGYTTVTTEAADGVNILVGNLKVGDGSPGQTINGEDVYINGLLEVDGTIHADGGVTGNVTGNASTVTITDNESTNETNAVLFMPDGDTDGGNFSPEADGDLTYNPSTGTLAVTRLVATGTILGPINIVVTTDGTESPTAEQMYGSMFIADHDTATSDTDYTLPSALAGMSACFYDNGAGAGGIIIDAASGDEILLYGAGVGAADAIDSPGVAGAGANGDFICLIAIDVTNWITMGSSGTWVDGGAD